MIYRYNYCHYFELFVIIHAWSLLVEVFFLRECIWSLKKPYSNILSMLDNSFYWLCFSKIFTFTACFFYVCFSNLPPFLCNMPSLLKFKSWVPHHSGTNTNNISLLVVESLQIFNKTLQEEGIYVWYIFVLNIVNEFDLFL